MIPSRPTLAEPPRNDRLFQPSSPAHANQVWFNPPVTGAGLQIIDMVFAQNVYRYTANIVITNDYYSEDYE